MGSSLDDGAGHGTWRTTLVTRLLLAFALFATAAVAVVMLTMQPGLRRTLLVLTVVPVALLLVAESLKARLSVRARSGLLVGCMLVVTLVAFLAVGFLSGAAMCGAATTLSAGLLFGRRGLAVVLVAITAGLTAVGWAMSTGKIATPPLRDVSVDSGAAWFRTGSITIFLLATMSIAVTFVVERLESALADSLRETKRREVAERERQEAQAAVVQAQKLEAVGRLAASVAHDFNNLLTVVGTSTELLARTFAPGTRERAILATVQDAVTTGAALTRQMVGFSRQREARPEVFDPGPRVRGLRRMITALMGSTVNVEWQVAENLGPVEMDPSQLEQIVMNLAVNARDAMPEGGRLSISLDASDRAEGPGVLLAIADTGVGMDAATRARAFEPFFTTKPEGLGTGLGLATVQRLVTQAGGQIELDSSPGNGTRVQVWIRRASADYGAGGMVKPTVPIGA